MLVVNDGKVDQIFKKRGNSSVFEFHRMCGAHGADKEVCGELSDTISMEGSLLDFDGEDIEASKRKSMEVAMSLLGFFTEMRKHCTASLLFQHLW